MLGNEVALWETLLAAIKLGVVVTPATTLLTTADLQDRVDRGRVRHVVTSAVNVSKFDGVTGTFTRIAVGDAPSGVASIRFGDGTPTQRSPRARRRAPAIRCCCISRLERPPSPKLVVHTHQSYPVGHLSTMYWIGLQPGDRHWNISSPGWAKHAWSSFFAPWNAEATVFIFNYARFNAKAVLDALVRTGHDPVRAADRLANADPGSRWATYRVALREVLSAGEPLNPEVIEQVQNAWGLTIRDGYGQTETTAQIGNSPGQPVKPGSMGRPLPGYDVVLLDPEGQVSARKGKSVCASRIGRSASPTDTQMMT